MPNRSGPHYPLGALRFRASIGYVIALAVEADDEHGASVAIAGGLVRCKHWRVSALGRGVADALAEAAVTELVGAPKKFYGIAGVVGSERGLHGAVVLVAKGQKVRPHAKRV
jgi:hypothetical protein